MKKSICFTIISILAIIVLLSTAAVCNMCGLSLAKNPDLKENSAEDNEKAGANSKKKTGKDAGQDTKSADSNISGDSKKDASSSGEIKIYGIIIGEYIKGKVENVDFLLADRIYSCHPDLLDLPDGTETYSWKVSGGSFDSNSYLMSWSTPSNEGWYTVELNMSKKNGSKGNVKTRVYINPSSILGEPLDPIIMPRIADIRVSPVSGIADNNYYTLTEYDVLPYMDGTLDLIKRVDFSVSAGDIIAKDNVMMRWRAPGAPQPVTITVTIYDISGIVLDSLQLDLNVVHGV
ncbi:MAG: hypothetical protein FJW68_08080 [Actinobacteria bacterium]|nr:hypothetical protein [Actinomycetota bacterium]